jgi:hypothetical protein
MCVPSVFDLDNAGFVVVPAFVTVCVYDSLGSWDTLAGSALLG